MKKIIIISLSIIASAFFVSCELTDFDLQDNPDQLTIDDVNPDYVLNEVQIRFKNSINSLNLATNDIMRYEAMRKTYLDAADPDALNSEWNNVYALRENKMLLERVIGDNEDFRFQRGIARMLHAFNFASMVDYLGDIPFSEANKGVDNFNPAPDDDETIYMALLEEIDLAIDDFNNVAFIPSEDLFYNGDPAKWIKFANSLKLKMLINIGNTSEINSVLAQGNLIESLGDDFQFQYSTAVEPTNSRHTFYNRAYRAQGQTRYIGNYFIWLLKDSKNAEDPRLRYYLYRQTDTDPTGTLLRCDGNPIYDYCYNGDYYWGGDHGDNVPVPNDRLLKTIYGLYPAGGAFDANNAVYGEITTNLGGAGILPILLSSQVEFLKAEAVLRLGANGDAEAALEAGIRESMRKVLNFSTIGVDPLFEATSADVDAYVTEVMDEYQLAGSNEEKLDIVIREVYIASFGNSIEAYNAYRRTGFPSNIQEPIYEKTIPFPRTFSLPTDPINRNKSLTQRPITNKVFWDTNPDGFIK